MNLFRYCGYDPVNKSDPLGLRFEVAGEIKRDFDKARAELSKDPSLKAMFDSIDKDKQHTVTIVASRGFGRDLDKIQGTNFGNSKFEWNSRAGISHPGGTQSPASVLAHEVAHADRIRTDPYGSRADFHSSRGASPFGNWEDKRVILGAEAQAANILHEDARSSSAGAYQSVDSVFGRPPQ
jgi:Effector protein